VSGTDAAIGLIVAVLVIGYLIFALLFPEKL
jgi:K+-transporting ATPase KdpF subunit